MLEWIEAHPGLASWVQALGSILALAVAFFVPWVERKRAEQVAVAAIASPLSLSVTEFFKATRILSARVDAQSREKTLAEHEAARDALMRGPIDRLDGRVAIYLHEHLERLEMLVRLMRQPRTTTDQKAYLPEELEWAKRLQRESYEAVVAARRIAPRLVEQKWLDFLV